MSHKGVSLPLSLNLIQWGYTTNSDRNPIVLRLDLDSDLTNFGKVQFNGFDFH